jgi:[ribosomal protein S5]-alanine N-acetyltransferase
VDVVEERDDVGMVPLTARGPTLTLRYPAPGDAAGLYALAADPQVTRFFSWRYTGPADAARWVAGRAAAREAGEWLEFVVEHRDHGLAGATGLTEPSRRDRRAVTGSWLGSAFWGTGVNAEAKALLARIAFDACGLERLGSYASVDNARSRAALEKLGFVHEGTLRSFHRHGDAVHDVDVFSLLRAEWERGPLHAVEAEVQGSPPAAFACDDSGAARRS